MSGFNLAELLPFYLDETDEHIATLNDALLRLEQDSTDAQALAEAFRMFHSIKGASVVMEFEPVKQLTHNLESLFDQFRSKKRTLNRPVLDLTFRCLDELRDYHRDLRAEGPSAVDLSELMPLVAAALQHPSAVPAPAEAAPPEAASVSELASAAGSSVLPAAPVASRDSAAVGSAPDELGRARAIRRPGNNEHRRLRLSQRPGSPSAQRDLSRRGRRTRPG
jgi:two-component system chemotaxis sensor kinase CheA